MCSPADSHWLCHGLCHGLIAFIYNTADELTPLFAAASPAVGGAGLLAVPLAVPLGFCGIILMLYAVLGCPKCLERCRAAMSCRLGFLATAPLVLVTPVAYYVSGSVVAAQLVLCLILHWDRLWLVFSGEAAFNYIPGHQFIPSAALSIVAAGTHVFYVVLKLPI